MLQQIEEACPIGAHAALIVPPTWIIRVRRHQVTRLSVTLQLVCFYRDQGQYLTLQYLPYHALASLSVYMPVLIDEPLKHKTSVIDFPSFPFKLTSTHCQQWKVPTVNNQGGPQPWPRGHLAKTCCVTPQLFSFLRLAICHKSAIYSIWYLHPKLSWKNLN